MNNINVKHQFFIDKIEKLDFCGKEIYSLKGGGYTQPYDIVKLEYQGHKHSDCVSCKSNYATVLKDVTNYHKKFPNCCEYHKKLSKENWFDAKNFEDAPIFYAEKLFYSYDHILNFIGKDEWKYAELFPDVGKLAKAF